jgi:DNA-directed RNA polymerase subunit beta'
MYYLTIEKHDSKGEGKYFSSIEEAVLAYDAGVVELQAPVKIEVDGKLEQTTVGRCIFWRALPAPIKDGHDPFESNYDGPEPLGIPGIKLTFDDINKTFGKKDLVKLIKRVHDQHGNNRTARMLDQIKEFGFRYATRSGCTIAVVDIRIPPEKPAILERSDLRVQALDNWLAMGFITEDEKYRGLKTIWSEATNAIEKAMMRHLDRLNSVFMMATSGARGNPAQVKQIGGMRGLMADPSGRIIPLPVRANLREGLTVLEYFISTHGARKGLADTALRTADSGYLTRRLIDVSQDVIIRIDDCEELFGESNPIEVRPGAVGNDIKVPLWERLSGRIAGEDIHYEVKGEKFVQAKGEMISEQVAVDIGNFKMKDVDLEVPRPNWPAVKVRSPLGCKAMHGLCAKCYGKNLATGHLVEMGETVGIIAAQSIGEPGTQLTLRTFHTGGVATEDIIQGLPRVEELFEARKPKGHACLSEIAGIVKLDEEKGLRTVTVMSPSGEQTSIGVPFSARLSRKDGTTVEVGDQLVEGFLNPHDILRLLGVADCHRYIVDQVQHVYRDQGVDINDRHIEVIARQMLKKVRVESGGDSDMLPGSLQDLLLFQVENKRVTEELEGEPAEAKRVLLGVTKASLATESFLSAASFQETTRVLTDAAIKGKRDELRGLKENVIIGKLIPAGTGMTEYREIETEIPRDATASAPANTPEDILAAELGAALGER